jgi:hypothetical protein
MFSICSGEKPWPIIRDKVDGNYCCNTTMYVTLIVNIYYSHCQNAVIINEPTSILMYMYCRVIVMTHIHEIYSYINDTCIHACIIYILLDVLTVSEDEIRAALRLVWERMKCVIEPSAAVGLAVALKTEFREVYYPSMLWTLICIML